MRVRAALAAAVVVVGAAACGSTSGTTTTADPAGSPSELPIGSAVPRDDPGTVPLPSGGAATAPAATRPGSTASTAPPAGSSGADTPEPATDPEDAPPAAGLWGTYLLTGTQTCMVPGGSPSTPSSPIFEGSTLTFLDEGAVVLLRNDPLTVPVTVDGTSFQIAAVFDLSGNLKPSGPPSSTDLYLNLEGASTDGGETISGSGSDSGVNCTYTFTGRRGRAG